MIGTLVNAGGIVIGSLIGLLLKKRISDEINTAIIKAEGIAIFIIGLNGVLTAMLYMTEGRLKSSGEVLLLVSLVIGIVAGESLRIDDRLNNFAFKVEMRLKADNFSKGFVTASLIFVIGAMGIVGALNDGLTGDSTVLFTKTVIDAITAAVLAATFGVGVMFAAIPVFVYQGAISLLAGVIAPYASDEAIRLFGMVGYALVMLMGINFLVETRLKTANLLPALIVPVVYYALFVNGPLATLF